MWFNFGIGTVDGFFNSDGEYQELGSGTIPAGSVPTRPPLPALPAEDTDFDTNAEIISYVAHLGGSVDVTQLSGYNISLGADLGIVNQELTADALTINNPAGGDDIEVQPETDVSSGFSPQQLTLFAEATGQIFGARAGCMFDFGADDFLENEDERANSDRQDAVMLGLSAQYPFMGLRVFGGVDYFLLLDEDGPFEAGSPLSGGGEFDGQYDQGNITSLRLGAGYRLAETVELGLTGLLRFNGEGEIEGVDELPSELGRQSDFESGYVFGLVPYVTYAPLDSPLQVSLRGAVQREYYDYGFSVTGENDIAPRLGATLGVTYGF